MLDGSEVAQIVVQVLDERYSLADFSLDLIPSNIIGWPLGGIVDPIGQLFAWLWGNIGMSFISLVNSIFGEFWHVRDYLWGVISGAFTSLGNAVTAIASGITSLLPAIEGIAPAIGNFFAPITNAVTSLGTSLVAVGSALNSFFAYLQQQAGQLAQVVGGAISTGLGQFISTVQTGWSNLSSFVGTQLSNLSTWIGSTLSSLGNALNGVWNGIVSGFTNVYTFLKGGWDTLWQGILGVRDWLYNGVKTVATFLSSMGTNLVSFITSLPGMFSDLWAWIKGGLDEVGQSLGTAWSGVTKFFKDGYDSIASGVGEVKLTLMGFINPLVDMNRGLSPFLTSYTDYLSVISKSFTAYHMSPQVIYHQNMDMYVGTAQLKAIFLDGSKNTSDNVSGILDSIGKSIVGSAQGLWSSLSGGVQSFVAWMGGGIGDLMKWASGLAGSHSPGLGDDIVNIFDSIVFGPLLGVPLALLTTLEEQQKAGAVKPTILFSNVVKSITRSITGAYGASMFLRALGDQLNVSVDIKPLGLGAGIQLRLGSLLKHLGRIFWRVPDIILSSLGYGLGMWLTQPYMRLLNSDARNSLPVEMPNLAEIQRIANRATLDKDYPAIFSDLRLFMEYYGYSDWSINWIIGPEPEITSGGALDFKDRFGRTLKLPLALRAAMPSGSEFAVMMVHDIFQNLGEFTKVMQVEGYHPDLASLYYIHHFKYPALSDLYQFVARAAAGFGWVKTTPTKEGTIGFDGLSPKALSDANSSDPVAAIPKLMDKLLPYAKWHDFAGFAWEEGFTADRLIMLDLMAEIPTRIDARWLYKWRLITEDQLMRVVVARGTHPDWIVPVATAEAMNAFADERTLVRTSVLRMYEGGFMGLEALDKKLNNLMEVTILGKKIPVRFLEGEASLLKVRSAYERVNKVVTGLFSDLRIGFERNITSKKDFLSIMGGTLDAVKGSMGIDTALDTKFLDLWINTLEYRRDIDTVQRIRYWSRLLIYRATELAASGDDILAIIDGFAKTAYLAPTEVDLMKYFATALMNTARRKSALALVKSSVKARMKAGVINQAQAMDELMKAGMTKEEADNFIWSEIKTRVVSIDKLVSMSEMVPISQGTLDAKMQAEGVPDDEKALYRPYAVAREISSEMGRVVTEMITDYTNGNMDDATFKSMLETLATMNGSIKGKYGVDWIVYSPEERNFLFFLAQLRRARKLKQSITGITVAA
jgi:hypothetical protein